MKNRIKLFLSELYADEAKRGAIRSRPKKTLREDKANKRLLRRELEQIRAVLAREPDIQAKITGIIVQHGELPAILIQVRVVRSGRKSAALRRLKTALAHEPFLHEVRLLLFKRRPKSKHPPPI
ncbi:MAG: hypothetical protein HY000_25940 [Planctomycetes bacterium]|nr:hypothetical protein [Planctomycetota bacterium]